MDLGIKVHGPTVRSMGYFKSRIFFKPINVLFLFFFLEVSTFLLVEVVVFPFTAYDFSPRGQYDFSEVFTEDVVGMQILRGQDSI